MWDFTEIRKIETDIARIKKDFFNYLRDTSQPLDERWEVFMTAPDFIFDEVDPYLNSVHDFLDHHNLTLYDTFYLDRYATVTYDHLFRIMKEDCPDMLNYLDEFRELVLKQGNRGFINDW